MVSIRKAHVTGWLAIAAIIWAVFVLFAAAAYAQNQNQNQNQNLVVETFRGRMLALESNLAACQRGKEIAPFAEETIQVDGVRYRFLAEPPNSFVGGIAVAALYRFGLGADGDAQGQFCVDGACLAKGNSCSAIAFVQPNSVRVYGRQ